MTDYAIKGSAGKSGYCDAIMNREPRTEFTGYYDKLNYEAGYKAGKESGVLFSGSPGSKRQQEGGNIREI